MSTCVGRNLINPRIEHVAGTYQRDTMHRIAPCLHVHQRSARRTAATNDGYTLYTTRDTTIMILIGPTLQQSRADPATTHLGVADGQGEVVQFRQRFLQVFANLGRRFSYKSRGRGRGGGNVGARARSVKEGCWSSAVCLREKHA